MSDIRSAMLNWKQHPDFKRLVQHYDNLLAEVVNVEDEDIIALVMVAAADTFHFCTLDMSSTGVRK